jgi:DNA-binding GntR family transcriptional regulator
MRLHHALFGPLDDAGGRREAVARRLGGAIALGLLGDGEQLPSEQELATSLNVSTVTLRDALADLRQKGLVETRRGRGGGSFVRV